MEKKLTDIWGLKEISISKKKNDIAWAFPTVGNNVELVRTQLNAWKKQFTQSDIVIVATNAKLLLPLLREFNGPISILERMCDTGAAGGFYSAQKWAFDRGYTKIMITDDDAVPITDNVIASLSSAIDTKGVMVAQATHHFYGKPGYKIKDYPEGNVAMCTMLDRSVFEQIGFSYAPYYMFWEDMEFGYRIGKAKIKCLIVDNALFDHPRPKIRPIPCLYYVIRNQLFYYLYQEPNFFRFLNSALLGYSLKKYFRQTGYRNYEALINSALGDAMHARLLKKEIPWDYPEESREFVFSRPVMDLDSASSKLLEKIKKDMRGKMNLLNGDITAFDKSPIKRVFRFFRRFNRNIVILNEVAFLNYLFAKKFVLFHEPTGKFYYYAENSIFQIVSNIFSVMFFMALTSLKFLFYSLRYRFTGRNRYENKRFGIAQRSHQKS